MLRINPRINQADGHSFARLHVCSFGQFKVGIGLIRIDCTQSPLIGKIRRVPVDLPEPFHFLTVS